MKKMYPLLILLSLIYACNSNQKTELHGDQPIAGTVYGDSIFDNNVRDIDAMLAIMDSNDSEKLVVRGVVDEVCKKKGCWVTMKLKNGETMRVTFKDYAFFVPKDIEGKEIVIDGKAIKEEVSIDDQRHYAEDAGAKEDEIAKITTPKKSLAFEAKGVVIL